MGPSKARLAIMKKLILLLLLCLPHLAKAESMTVMTMNLHCFDGDWRFRLSTILNTVSSISPEVISFQEVCENPVNGDSQIVFIRNYLLEKGYPVNAFESQFTHMAWDNKFSEFILLISKQQVSNLDKGFLPPSLMQRSYIGFEINNRWYINTHLEFRADNGNYRRNQIDFLTSRFWNRPNVIMGDFNSSPEDSEQNIFREKFYTAYFPGSTQTGNDGNSHTNIDGFWFSKTFYSSTKLITGAIMFKEKINGDYLSDHYAVITQINFK
jgi:endonuclease/exonuclease/phosphatase family metal-dependent hydrolase